MQAMLDSPRRPLSQLSSRATSKRSSRAFVINFTVPPAEAEATC